MDFSFHPDLRYSAQPQQIKGQQQQENSWNRKSPRILLDFSILLPRRQWRYLEQSSFLKNPIHRRRCCHQIQRQNPDDEEQIDSISFHGRTYDPKKVIRHYYDANYLGVPETGVVLDGGRYCLVLCQCLLQNHQKLYCVYFKHQSGFFKRYLPRHINIKLMIKRFSSAQQQTI